MTNIIKADKKLGGPNAMTQNEKRENLNHCLNKLFVALSAMKSEKDKLDNMVKDTIRQAKDYKMFVAVNNQKCLNELKTERPNHSQANKYCSSIKSIIENLNTLNEWFVLALEEESCQAKPTVTITQEQATNYLNIIINVLDKNIIEDHYSNNLMQFLHLNYIYRITIQPPIEINRLNENAIVDKEFKWKTDDTLMKNNLNLCKYVEVTLIKRRKNSLIIQLVHYLRSNYYKYWIMRMDENNNILIKGVLKDSYFRFENHFLTPCAEYKNLAYIHIKVYFNAIDLLGDYSNEYDKTTFKPEYLNKMLNAYQALEKIRESALAKLQHQS